MTAENSVNRVNRQQPLSFENVSGWKVRTSSEQDKLWPASDRDVLNAAKEFCGTRHEIGTVSGTRLGERVENLFGAFAVHHGVDIGKPGNGADIPELDWDIKALKSENDSHVLIGYGTDDEPPSYSVLAFRYQYDGHILAIENAYFIPAVDLDWKPCNKFFCNKRDLERYEI